MDDQAVLLHGRLTSTRSRWARARDVVNRHLADTGGSTYVSWSGGKDSTAVALLATAADPAVPVVRFTHGVDFPEVVDYCAAVAGERGWDYRVVEMATEAEFLAGVAAHIADPRSGGHADPGHHAAVEAELGRPVEGLLWGLRADESTGRRWNGVTRRRRDGVVTCAPLHQWSTLDVVSFLAAAGAGLCPVYARLAEVGAPPESQRVGYAVGTAALEAGRAVWLKRGWPDLWARYAAVTPGLREMS